LADVLKKSNFVSMKRRLLHIIFWFTYYTFLVVTEFVWVKYSMPENENTIILWNAVRACMVTIIPQILFAYYISYVTLAKIVSEKRKILINIVEVLFLFLFTVVITQFLAHRIVGRYIYGITEVSYLYQLAQYLNFVIYIGFVSGIMVMIKYVKQRIATINKERELIKEKLSTELKMLRNQLNPHFLFNTLNNIYALSRKQSNQTPDAIMKLSELLSFMLYESGKDFISIKKEVTFLQDYISLEKIRYNERLTVVFDKKIDNYDQPIAPLLLLPLVENAFKHGASQLRYDSFINIFLSVNEGILSFEICNNYDIAQHKAASTQIGLQNTQRQLELLYKEQSLQYFTAENMFNVRLSINLNSYGTI
jgi:sensor histidine kinase YesM